MKTIAIINLKGGVGKTTTTVSMAHLLATKYSLRVLVVDNDKQGNASMAFSAFRKDSDYGTPNMLRTETAKGNICITKYGLIDIIPCNLSMLLEERDVLLEPVSRVDRYKNALKGIQAQYDYCIIDNPPDIGMSVINALVAADEVIIPIQLDDWSLNGLEDLVNQMDQIKEYNPKAVFRGCLITNYERDETSISAEEWMKVQEVPYFETKIRHTKKAKPSTFHRKPVTEYARRSVAAQDYRRFVKEYMGQ